jgi:hypothetical protein
VARDRRKDSEIVKMVELLEETFGTSRGTWNVELKTPIKKPDAIAGFLLTDGAERDSFDLAHGRMSKTS